MLGRKLVTRLALLCVTVLVLDSFLALYAISIVRRDSLLLTLAVFTFAFLLPAETFKIALLSAAALAIQFLLTLRYKTSVEAVWLNRMILISSTIAWVDLQVVALLRGMLWKGRRRAPPRRHMTLVAQPGKSTALSAAAAA